MNVPFIPAVMAVALVSACATTPGGPADPARSSGFPVPAPVPAGGFAIAAADANRFCVANGPTFAGTAAAVIFAGGRRIENGPGREDYRLPSGNTLSLTTDRPGALCVVYTSDARSYAGIGAAMSAQPGLAAVPGVAEVIALPGQPAVRFENTWRAAAHGVEVRVGGVPGGLTTIVAEPVAGRGPRRPGRGPTTAPPVIAR